VYSRTPTAIRPPHGVVRRTARHATTQAGGRQGLYPAGRGTLKAERGGVRGGGRVRERTGTARGASKGALRPCPCNRGLAAPAPGPERERRHRRRRRGPRRPRAEREYSAEARYKHWGISPDRRAKPMTGRGACGVGPASGFSRPGGAPYEGRAGNDGPGASTARRRARQRGATAVGASRRTARTCRAWRRRTRRPGAGPPGPESTAAPITGAALLVGARGGARERAPR
jgi:hypothetical protein